MAVVKFRYVHIFRDRHGKTRCYFRRRGFERVPLPHPSEPGFSTAYQDAMAGASARKLAIGKGRVAPKSVKAAALGYMHSIEFRDKRITTQETQRRALERFVEKFGDLPVSRISARHVREMMAQKVETPHAANYLIQTIRLIVRYAIEEGWRSDDPTVGVRKIRVHSDGYHAWNEGEGRHVAAFSKSCVGERGIYSSSFSERHC